MSRKIVFVNQATGYLTIDIINSFAKHYDEVHLICGSIRVQDVEIDKKVAFTRIIKTSRRSHITRFLGWFAGSVQVFFILLFRFRKYEIFYVSLPPFAYLSSLLLPNKFSLLMFDVYPDVLKMLNIKETNVIYRLWARWNRKLFAKAHRVYTIGDSLAALMSQYGPVEKIHVVPLWTGLINVHPVPKHENPFIAEHALKGKFVVQYSGNIGGTHNIEVMIEAAKLLKDHHDILFLIIGRGLKVPLVNKMIEEHKLDNCMLLPFQPDDVIRYSIAAADLSVVLIDDKIAEVSIPSKVYNIMAVGSGILSISPEKSEINKLVQQYNIGANFAKSDVQQVADFILKVKNTASLQQQFSTNAVAASANYTMDNADKYVDIYFKA
ncbi:MAG TPA: glycosyltransferase family 4 protein [Ferruginibacter sp.]|nr:glycosyltransferase family 4 protein [Ferruginibacter sp.]HPH90291.1 glycosyltransferase family 4 protein [Ferruginibacter sp.]